MRATDTGKIKGRLNSALFFNCMNCKDNSCCISCCITCITACKSLIIRYTFYRTNVYKILLKALFYKGLSRFDVWVRFPSPAFNFARVYGLFSFPCCISCCIITKYRQNNLSWFSYIFLFPAGWNSDIFLS